MSYALSDRPRRSSLMFEFHFLFNFFIEIAKQLDTYLDIIFYLTILCIF